ncbi:ImmA/IrrE family metallo-endopeptidase [Streptomyces sp. NPDC032472]|uniref:ImmA/IrrE family metallo-endopeptidase n=1 Tax=Streptomyces sp. NPDC032472 TaxID=3155018 RepID=UPI0033E1B776
MPWNQGSRHPDRAVSPHGPPAVRSAAQPPLWAAQPPKPSTPSTAPSPEPRRPTTRRAARRGCDHHATASRGSVRSSAGSALPRRRPSGPRLAGRRPDVRPHCDHHGSGRTEGRPPSSERTASDGPTHGNHGIVVLAAADEAARTVDAFSSRPARPVAILTPNRTNDAYRHRFTAAHELGHLVLHGDATGDSRQEREAEYVVGHHRRAPRAPSRTKGPPAQREPTPARRRWNPVDHLPVVQA